MGSATSDLPSSQGTAYHVVILAFAIVLGTPGCGPSAPEAPSGLSARSQDGSVALEWEGVGGDVSGYNVYRSQSPFQDPAEAQKANSDFIRGTSYTDDGLSNRTTYHYRVTAVTQSGGLLGIGSGSAESNLSGEVSKTPFSEPPNRP
jgi:hypothetical protein